MYIQKIILRLQDSPSTIENIKHLMGIIEANNIVIIWTHKPQYFLFNDVDNHLILWTMNTLNKNKLKTITLFGYYYHVKLGKFVRIWKPIKSTN